MAQEDGPESKSKFNKIIDRFPPGKAMLFLTTIFVLAFIGILLQPRRPKVTLEFWTFAKPHHEGYVKVMPAFHASHPGVSVAMQLMGWQAMHEGLQAAFIAGRGAPDLVEVESSRMGPFFAGPLEGIGFLDLTDRLKDSGYYDRIVQSRFSTYTSRGRIFGVPHDVHPLGLAYRHDLWQEAGVNMDEIETWEDFIQAGRKVTRDLDGDGHPDRYALELDPSSSYLYEIMLKQREIFYFRPDGSLALDDPDLLETLVTYIRMAAGPEKIGTSLGGGAILTQAVMDGYLCGLWLPDWRVGNFKQDMPKAAGLLRVMPLPAWKKGERRVSTWGGTMMGICKACKNPDLAWELLVYLYFNPADLAERYTVTGIIPPLKEAWNLPVFRAPEPFFGGQHVGEIFTALGPDVPRTQMTPFTTLVTTKMGEVIDSCVKWYDAKRTKDLDGLREYARGELDRISGVVKLQMSRLPFYEP